MTATPQTEHARSDVAVIVPEDIPQDSRDLVDAEPDSPPAPGPRHARRRRDRVRSVVHWILFIACVLVLWPAKWGGFTGLIIVQGQSMEPTYSTGDVVITLRQSTYEVGDVISYAVPDGQPGAGANVIHRVYSVDTSGEFPIYTTIGDNNDTADQWAIPPENVRGAAITVIPGLGTIITPAMLPYVLAGCVGLIVTVVLWTSSPRDDDEDDADDEGAEPTP